MASHNQHGADVIPWPLHPSANEQPPADYVTRRSMSGRRMAEATRDPEMLKVYGPNMFDKPTFGEKLVDHFRARGDLYIGFLIGGIAVSLLICGLAQVIVRMGLV